MHTKSTGQKPMAITDAQQGPLKYKHNADFSVITVGTGCPEPVIGRTGPCTLVQYKGSYFLVDVGDGTTQRLCQMGIPIGDINSVLFTHHHADHNEGYIKWLINSWMAGRSKLDLVGPPKTKRFHEMIMDFYKEDLEYRKTLEGLGSGMNDANIIEYEGENSFELDGVKITTAELTHTMYNLGYRFEVGGKVIVVSGDTSYDKRLIDLAKNADVLVMDSGALAYFEIIGASRPRVLGQKQPVPGPKNSDDTHVVPHPQPGAVAKMAAAANVKKLVLTHFPPFIVDEEKAIKDIKRDGFNGEVVMGKDLLEIIP